MHLYKLNFLFVQRENATFLSIDEISRISSKNTTAKYRASLYWGEVFVFFL